MSFAVIKNAGYVLVHTPDMVIHNGSTQTTERIVNPNSEYLKELPKHLRSFEEVVSYYPNQTYIGNLRPEELGQIEAPWFDKKMSNASRKGKLGEIIPQDEFIGMIKISDVFDLVLLDKTFTAEVKNTLSNHPLISEELISRLGEGVEITEIEDLVNNEHSEPLYHQFKLVGCVKRAHDVDLNLTAHTMLENLVVKASGTLAMLNLLGQNGIDPNAVDYVIECSEEACGDMNQRGGGNFAKSIAEMCGCNNATGSDTRGFCAAPTHALIEAASLVKAGTYKNVVMVAGGASAKLGMNGKDHVKKEMPIIEDVIGGFAVLISENDGVSPIIRNDQVGKHTVGTGSSPQAVITALITQPLDKAGLRIRDVDKYSVEMQNPDITKAAGAGDVPLSNYKMIAALGVKRGDLEKKDIMDFVEKHGMVGWAPTQGHIPSGVPYLGFIKEAMDQGEVSRVMIVGKGSLFLGRMTNLFDGVSVIIEKNNGVVDSTEGVSKETIKKIIAESLRDMAATLTIE